GPVFRPSHIKRLACVLRLNPMLDPWRENDSPNRARLTWNMVFPSSQCQLSQCEAPHSRIASTNEAATIPRVAQIRLVRKGYPWTINIDASDPHAGVTCADIIEQLDRHLRIHVTQRTVQELSPEEEDELVQIYHSNRAHVRSLGVGMRRLEWLRKATMFCGV
ncbi:hypothetical protein K488DRAFT_23515, partial [Vararia minispora EC-137]